MAELGFSFATRTIDYFGSKSITSNITAMFELVKNSRDANAKNIEVYFNRTPEDPSIEVRDDGDGMSTDDICNRWMVIGTNSRLVDNKTKDGRPVWGEMGIGRIACQKLGNKTELITVKDGTEITIPFDWSLFENPKTTVDKIKFPMESRRKDGATNGTILRIAGLKSRWDSKDINDLKNQLSVMIADEEFDSTKITVRVDAGDGEAIGKNYSGLRKQVTDKAPFQLEARFDGCEMEVKILARAGKKEEWKKQDVAENFNGNRVGPFEVTIYYFPRAPTKQKNTTLERYYEQHMGTEKLETFLKHNRGLYLYRDGVWMKPYGRGNDWLSMEARARQDTRKIGLTQIYGMVRLSKKHNPGILPASHRETLIENDEFKDLKKMMEAVFKSLSDFMISWKKEDVQDGIVGPEISGEPGRTEKEVLANLSKMSRLVPKPYKKQFNLLASGLERIGHARRQSTEQAMADMGEMREYEKNLATLGIATSFMARNVTGPLEKNMQMLLEGEKMRERIRKDDWTVSTQDQERSDEIIKSMRENQNKMLHFMRFVGILSHHIAQSQNMQGRRTQVDVLECWNTVRDGFQDRQRELNITAKHDWKDRSGNTEKLVVKIDRIDLECVLTNLYLNSIAALAQGSTSKPAVTFRYWHSNGSLHVEFSDNGIGIPKGKHEEVFEPFKMVHSPSNEEMHGHGMGLHIVRKIVDEYDGTAESVPVSVGATFRLVFNKTEKVAA